MKNYCSNCDKIYHDEEFNYCPICSAELKEMDEDIYKIKELIERYGSEKNIFKIDEEKKILKFKWNDKWMSESIEGILADTNAIYDPPQPNFIEVVTFIKDRWDEQLKNDLPDYNKKLTFNQVKHCEGFMRLSYETGPKGWPRFAASVNIKELLHDLKGRRINDFGEIRKDELYLILISKADW